MHKNGNRTQGVAPEGAVGNFDSARSGSKPNHIESRRRNPARNCRSPWPPTFVDWLITYNVTPAQWGRAGDLSRATINLVQYLVRNGRLTYAGGVHAANAPCIRVGKRM